MQSMRKSGDVPRCLATSLLLSGILLLPVQTSRAELVKPQANDRQVALIVTRLLTNEHLLKRPLNDEISRRAMETFLKQLDPIKIYFYQSDIDEFMERRDELDDFVKQGDLGFAYEVFNRFLKRIDERVGFVHELLKVDHDFTVDEEMVTDPEVAEYARTQEEAYDRWRKRIKYDLLVLKTELNGRPAAGASEGQEDPAIEIEVEGEGAVDRLTRRYDSYQKRMKQFSSDDLLEMYLSAITTAFDPHTNYMSRSSLENFYISMKLNLEGIGAALMMTDGYTVVSKVIPGGAADKHGKLKPEDRVVSVGQGDEGEMVDVIDMNLNDVVKLIRGKAGTVVRLGVKPANKNEVEIYTITRARIELTDSEARSEIIPFGQKPDGEPYQVGVIDLPSFYMDMAAARRGLSDFKSTTRDVKAILEGFQQKNVDVVVLDLTRNGGGSLTEAINLTGLFIDQGPVVQVKDADDRVQHYDDLERGMAWQGPLVVLTSKFSASASEILAGAIQDYGRGIVVGDQSTHGKGTVQSLLELGPHMFSIPNPPQLGALKITMQQFYRPSGESTQKRGVLADVAMPSLTTHMDVSESDLDFPIDFDRVDKAPFTPALAIDPNLTAQLNTRSAERRKSSDDFLKLERRIEQYRRQKAKSHVTLNEEKFFAERAEFDAEKEDEANLKEQIEMGRPVFTRNYYNDEVLHVAVDYADLLNGLKFAGNRVALPTGPVPQ
jgi:carboxyl-terminal processing protease